jgi:DNA ligase-associated metallophosphoesterase
MPNNLTHRLYGQTLILLGERALLWLEEKILVVADIHLGKAGAFRKEGIPVPPGTTATDLDRLAHLIDEWTPRQLVFLGDLIHDAIDAPRFFSRQVTAWRDRYRATAMLLATGNHDRRADHLLTPFRFDGIEAQWEMAPFRFTHRPQQSESLYGIAGHVHPAVRVFGKGRQRETLPCFYFAPGGALLPAFGGFTGTHIIQPSRDDRVFVVAEDTVLDTRSPSNALPSS